MSEKAQDQEGREAPGAGVAETVGRYDAPPADVDVASLVAGLDPVDWVQLRLSARLSPGQRIRSAMEAHAFAVAGLRGTLRRRFPDLSDAELNMRVLAYLTPVRLPGEEQA